MFKSQKDLERLDKKFHRIASTLKKFELQQIDPNESDITLEDLFVDLDRHASTQLFMGFYSRKGIETALERFGILAALKERGFEDVRVELDLSDAHRHRLAIRDAGTDAMEESRVAELHVQRVSSPQEWDFRPRVRRGTSDFLRIEWLCLQNPRRDFTAERPALPGQSHPGLGIGPEVMEMLQLMAERLGLAGIVAAPEYYHNAALYSLRYHFIDPRCEGRLLALMRDLAGRNLSETSWAVHLGAVLDLERGESITWTGREMVFPLNRGVARYFESAAWRRKRDAWLTRSRFRLDEDRFRQLKARSEEYRLAHVCA